jgi:hypothetical protein
MVLLAHAYNVKFVKVGSINEGKKAKAIVMRNM